MATSPTPDPLLATHVAHRERFLERLAGEGAAAIVAAGHPVLRNGDSPYRFRPASDFTYLTGFAEPESLLLLLPGRDEGQSVLFLRARNQEEEIWTGRRLGIDAAPAVLGVDQAFDVAELWERLPGLLRGRGRIVHRLGEDAERDRRLLHLASRLRGEKKTGALAPCQWLDPALWLHEARLVKDAGELDAMRRAAEISAEAHVLAMGEAAPGGNEAQIDALLSYTFRRRGATGAAYTNIVAGGENACILHYEENDAPLVDGELLLVDAGAEWCWYASDVTRTFPVNGTFSPEQRALYEVVLAANKRAVDAVRPGARFDDVHAVAVEEVARGLLALGLLRGSLEEVVQEETYERFFMHRTGHWLGLDVHDCGAYHPDGGSRRLEPGMVTTVEPGIYVAPDDGTVDARWRGIGIRIEDDVAVTKDGREVLSRGVPKEVDEVEAACGATAPRTPTSSGASK